MGAIFYPDVPFESLMIPYILKEIYFDNVYNDILKSDMTIVDVGANIGLVTSFMRPFAKKIYAVEPSPLEFEALKKNKEYNAWDNVELFQFAIADKDGEMELSVNSRNRTGNSIMVGEELKDGTFLSVEGKCRFNFIGSSFGERVKVKTKRMDTLFDENHIEQVDFMKFDVEGAEAIILKSDGFRNVADRIKAIEIEFHYPDWEELSGYLLSLGYHGRRFHTDAVICLYQR